MTSALLYLVLLAVLFGLLVWLGRGAESSGEE